MSIIFGREKVEAFSIFQPLKESVALAYFSLRVYNLSKTKGGAMEEKLIGKITHYFGKIGVGIIELTDSLRVGDTIHVKGHTSDFNQQVVSMQKEHVEVTEATAGDAIGIKVDQKVHVNDNIYRVLE